MGYRSEVVIAIRKEVLARCLIERPLPAALVEDSGWTSSTYSTESTKYWKMEGVKWYSSFEEIAAIQEFFEWIADLESEQEPHVPLFGALRHGEEDDDIQTWGSPSEFDIYTSRTIDAPF